MNVIISKCIQWCMGDRFHSESFFWKKDNTCHNY